MSRNMWSPRILLRYTLLQLPGTLLFILLMAGIQMWVGFSSRLFWAAAILWVLKDAIMYPFIWRSYDPEGKPAGHALIGMKGIAVDRLDPEGYIRIRGELWKARIRDGQGALERGSRVEVAEIRGLTLIVVSGE